MAPSFWSVRQLLSKIPITQRRHVPGGGTAWWLLLLFLISGSHAQTIQVTDADGHSTSVRAAEISKLPHLTVAVAGILLGDAVRGPRISDVPVEGAVDGYKVAFALAETDPAFATSEIILADMRDGKPLDTMKGPLRVVAPGDKRPARWVRQVSSPRIVAAR